MRDSRIPEEVAAFEARLRGRVQGVGFRYFAQRVGQRLDLRGLVRNEWDGSVYVKAEGPRAVLEEFLVQLRQGPSAAVVEGCEVRWIPPGETRGGGGGFRIGTGDERGGG